MGSIGHPCRTIQGSARYLPLMTVQALREVSFCDEARPTTQMRQWSSSNNSCVHNQIATFGLFGRQSVTLNIGLNIGCSHNRPSEQSVKWNIGQALEMVQSSGGRSFQRRGAVMERLGWRTRDEK